MRWINSILLILLLYVCAPAQWEYGGRDIGYGDAYVSPKIAPDGQGGFFIVWDGYYGGSDTKEIILNRIDTAGGLLFGEAGLRLTDDTVNQENPLIAPDGQCGCYLLWCDNVAVPYAQRVSAEGEMLWGTEGIRLIYGAWRFSGRMQIYADSVMGLLAICDARLFDRLIGQRSNPIGDLLWDSSGVALFLAPDTTGYGLGSPSRVTCCGNWLYMALVADNGGLTQSDIYIQKFNADAGLPWGLSGRPVSIARYGDLAPQVVSDGAGGAVVGWLSSRIFSQGPAPYADRISPEGNSLWQTNGVMLYQPSNTSRFGLELFSFDSLFAAVGLGGDTANYQVIYPDGQLRWETYGYTLGHHNLQAAVFDGQFIYTMYYEGWHFFASKRDIDANEYWTANSWIHGFLESWDLLPDGEGGLFVAYSWYRDFLTNWVGIQRIYPDGNFGEDTVGVYEAEPIPLPESPFNLTAYPNPFNSATLISFDVHAPAEARLKMYDVLGRLVDSVEFDQLSAGHHSLLWDTQRSALKIASGSYVISLEIDKRIETKSVVILK